MEECINEARQPVSKPQIEALIHLHTSISYRTTKEDKVHIMMEGWGNGFLIWEGLISLMVEGNSQGMLY